MILPCFSSHFSFGKSILTLEKPEKIDINKPISIFSIGKKYSLKEIFLIENNLSGFIEAYKNSINNNFSLRFGLKLVICANLNDKSEASFKTESKIIVWIKNTDGYNDLIKIYSKAATDGFYYIPRIDWKTLCSMWTDNLMLSLPSYSSFLHNNHLKGTLCIPELGKIKPSIMVSNCGLPFDCLIEKYHTEYAKNNQLELLQAYPIYFYSKECFEAYRCFRAIHNRSTINAPQIDHFGSKQFNWESYCNKANIKF